jgi:hypothetical protein
MVLSRRDITPIALITGCTAFFLWFGWYWFFPEKPRNRIDPAKDMAVLKQILPLETWQQSQLKAVDIFAPKVRMLQSTGGYAGFLLETTPKGLSALLADRRWRKWDRLSTECTDGATTYGVTGVDTSPIWTLGKSKSFREYETFLAVVVTAKRTSERQPVTTYNERMDAVLVYDDTLSPTITMCIATSPLWYATGISEISTPVSALRE